MGERYSINSRSWYVTTNAIYSKHPQRKQDALFQLRNLEYILEGFKHYAISSAVPPAAMILSFADWLNLLAVIFKDLVMSPLPSILTAYRSDLIRPLETSDRESITEPGSKTSNWLMFTSEYTTRSSGVNPVS